MNFSKLTEGTNSLETSESEPDEWPVCVGTKCATLLNISWIWLKMILCFDVDEKICMYNFAIRTCYTHP